MFNIKNIAVIVDFNQPTHHGLERAVAIANLFKAKVTIISCVYQRSVEFSHLIKEINADTIEKETLDFYYQQLNKLVSNSNLAQKPDIKLLWNKSFHRGVIDFINSEDFDLTIKTTTKNSPLKKIFTPLDWHLLRELNTPILFVKQGHWPSAGNVLGAINIDSDLAHQRLNQHIISGTIELAKLCGGSPHLLNVFPWPLIDIEQLSHLIKGEDHYSKIKITHQEAVLQYVKSTDIDPNNIHIAEGLSPQETIPGIIEASQSELLVLGCVGRSGIKAITIGNTAEKILDDIQCEVLAIK